MGEEMPDALDGQPTFRGDYGDIRIGAKIGPGDRYVIKRLLGRGGMGEVYLANDTVAGAEVAIKLVPREVSLNEDEMEQVRKNFNLVRNLHHPSIAAVTQIERIQSSGEYFLVMEHVPGETLHKKRLHSPDEKLPVDEAIRICSEVAKALDYAHQNHVMHRDVKPNNVIITPKGGVKITDFGLAAQIVFCMSRISKTPIQTSGTRPYMAPEQWEGKLQNHRTDQWALAVVFYELVAGRLPFPANDPLILERQVVGKRAKSPAELDDARMDVLLKALAKEKEERFADCRQFMHSLRSPYSATPATSEILTSSHQNEPTRTQAKAKQTPQKQVAISLLRTAHQTSQRGDFFEYAKQLAKEITTPETAEQVLAYVESLSPAWKRQSAPLLAVLCHSRFPNCIRLRAGRCYLKARHWETTKAVAESVLQSEPNNAEASQLLGDAFRRRRTGKVVGLWLPIAGLIAGVLAVNVGDNHSHALVGIGLLLLAPALLYWVLVFFSDGTLLAWATGE
jgi:serine/threonine protein kinase